MLREGRFVRSAVARGRNEYRAAGGNGAGYSAGRIVDTRQPPTRQRFRARRLVPPDDANGLARVIIDQWDNFDRAFHMGRAARSRVEQEFSIQAIARQHLALFDDILQNHCGGQ